MKKLMGTIIVLLLVFASQAQPVIENKEEAVISSRINLKDAFGISVKKPQVVYGSDKNNYTIHDEDDYELRETETHKIKKAGPATQMKDGNRTITKNEIDPGIKYNLGIPFDVSDMKGKDPMAAVGDNYIIVTDGGWLTFLRKNGQPYSLSVDGNPHNRISVADFFYIFTKPTLNNGQSNPAYVSNYFPRIPNNIPDYCSKGDKGETGDGLITEMYDAKVIYEKSWRRYVILAALRNRCTRNESNNGPEREKECMEYCVRLNCWAVSVSENPADGFYIYRNADNNYRDWPNLYVDKDYLVFSNRGNGYNKSSLITIFSFPDLAAGSGSPKKYVIKRNDGITPKAVLSVQGTNDAGALIFAERSTANRTSFWYIKKPSNRADMFRLKPPLQNAGGLNYEHETFNQPVPAMRYDNGFIHIASMSLHVPRINNDARTLYGVTYIRLPFYRNGSAYTFNTNIALGYIKSFYTHLLYSYEDVSLNMMFGGSPILGFTRYPLELNSSEKPQSRMKLLDDKGVTPLESIVVHESEVASRTRLEPDYNWITADPSDMQKFYFTNKYFSADNSKRLHISMAKVSDLK